jgi:hypothetical protein
LKTEERSAATRSSTSSFRDTDVITEERVIVYGRDAPLEHRGVASANSMAFLHRETACLQ